MAHSGPNVIDGFTSIQAVRRSGQASRQARTRPSSSRLPNKPRGPSGAPAPGKPAARIGHTAMPERHEIVCYECGFAFVLQGRFEKTYCPKCRQCLTFETITIDGVSRRTVKTIGVVTVTPAGKIAGGRIVATDVILAGAINGGQVCVSRRLELREGATFKPDCVSMRDVRIHAGARIALDHDLVCRDLEVDGFLKARVHADGLIAVRRGGFLSGEIHGPRLAVQDGAGLSAVLDVGPGCAPAAPRKTSTAPAEKPTLSQPETRPEKKKRAPASRKGKPRKAAQNKST
ncbi:MAG: polymer-forming cytoskeletal protein [Lentisphaerae bacterium]|nr:polymer-forming cytoskeletal protein [Lentisphaerota bacterium]